MDDSERHKDIIVSSIYSLLCLCVSTGGVLLVLYVFFPALSQPWQPITALILIGSPWLVWLLTYIYACIKTCCIRRDGCDRQIPTRQTTRSASTSAHIATAEQKGGGKQDSVASSNDSEIP
ncbi:hypothetical protein OROHE_004826 [Orobanche hederae]